jgi:hypothetical protein
MASEGNSKKDCPAGGFEIQEVQNNSFLFFPNIKNLDKVSEISFSVSSLKGGKIEIREGKLDGNILGECKIGKTGSWKIYQNFSCKLKKSDSTDIYLKFINDDENSFHLDWFRFE